RRGRLKREKLPETAKKLVIWCFSCKISGSSQIIRKFMSQKKTVQKRTDLDADMGSMDLLPLFNRRAGINNYSLKVA
ncbi:hypothetical protein, partial [Clostridium vitabionis]|uniref:hypothetical protein n=1 Tax=Clostridium vitabionis TaxID=2784388 RepID=UPI001A9ACE4D